MTKATKRCVDAAVAELKRDGYMVLMIMFDQKKSEDALMGSAVEVTCSETNDPQMLGAMLKTVMGQLTGQDVADHLIN